MTNNLKGALWMLGAVLGFTANTVIVKHLLGEGIDLFTIAFVRVVIALVILIPFLARSDFAPIRHSNAPAHIFRAFFGSAGMLMSFYALGHIELAEFTALTFTAPLFVVILSVVILKEVVRIIRWSATAVGFIGMLVIIRPWGLFADGVEPAIFVTLLAALFFAFGITLIKRFPPGESEVAMLFYFCITTVGLTAFPALGNWSPLEFEHWLYLGGLAGASLLGQMMVIKAFRTAEASFVAPFEYTKLLVAAAFGFFIFGETTDIYTWIGAAIIAASSAFIAHREATLMRARKKAGLTQVKTSP